MANTIMKVKVGEFKENMKKMSSTPVPVLTRTYAFLMNLKEEDDEVTKFKKDGLVAMVLYRFKQLMHVGCMKCNKVHHTPRTKVPQVTCRLCGIGACKECFTAEERNNKWIHLCKVCDKEVACMKGEGALGNSHIKKSVQSKDKVENPKEVEIEKVTEVITAVVEEELVDCAKCKTVFRTTNDQYQHSKVCDQATGINKCGVCEHVFLSKVGLGAT